MTRGGTEAAVTGAPTAPSARATSRTTSITRPGGKSGGKGARRTPAMLTLLGAPVKEMGGRGEASVTVRHWRTAGQELNQGNNFPGITDLSLKTCRTEEKFSGAGSFLLQHSYIYFCQVFDSIKTGIMLLIILMPR